MHWQFTKQVVEDVNQKFYDIHMLCKLLEFKVSGTQDVKTSSLWRVHFYTEQWVTVWWSPCGEFTLPCDSLCDELTVAGSL